VLWDEDLIEFKVVEKIDSNIEVVQYGLNIMTPQLTRDFFELR
jgi:hypothetical protein